MPKAFTLPTWRAALAAIDRTKTMDIEQINAIGTALVDLSARTEQLRGYL